MKLRNVLGWFFLMLTLFAKAQTDFPALKQQFLDYRKADQQDSALFIARKMNTLALKEQTDTSFWYALSFRYIGNPFNTLGQLDSTKFYWGKSIELFEKYHPENSDYPTGVMNLSFLYFKLDDFSSMEKVITHMVEIQKKVLGEDNPAFAMQLFVLGNLFVVMGDYYKAETSFKQSLAIRKRVIGEDHPDVAICLKSLGDLYSTINNYTEAIIVFKEYLEIKMKSEDSLELASALDNLGEIYIEIGEFKAAEANFKKALEIRKSVLNEGHPEVSISLQKLGEFYFLEMDDYKSAEPYLKKAVEITKKTLGKEHSDYAKSLSSLGLFYYSMGDFKAAELLYRDALEITANNKGLENLDYMISLIHLGVIYNAVGDYNLAERNYKQALEIIIEVVGDNQPLYANVLDFLGDLKANMRDYNSAELYYQQSIEIIKKVLGEEHLDYANSLQSLAKLYDIMGDNKMAEHLYKQVLEIRKSILGMGHPDYASSLSHLASLYYKIENFSSAEPLYKEALEIINMTLGNNNPNYIYNENWLAYLYTRTNREMEAYELLSNNFIIISKQIANTFEWLSDNQKEVYWNKESTFYDNLSWFANKAYSKVPESVALNYNAALLTKSKLLEAKISKENYYAEVDQIREELDYRKKLLYKLESDGSDKKELMIKLSYEADSLDKLLELSWPIYAEQKRNLLITWDQVQQNLDQGEAAIEFVRYKNDDDSPYYYNALVLKKGDKNPNLVQLCNEQDLLAIMSKVGFSQFYKLIWQPLEALLEDVNTIYYAPVGELNNIPFQALYAAQKSGDELIAAKTNKRGVVIEEEQLITEQNASYLIDKYSLHQLTSTRYLAMGLKQKAKEQIPASLAMIGGVNYDYLPGAKTQSKPTKPTKNQSRSSESVSGKLAYLEGTKTEVEQINDKATLASWQTTLMEGNAATEETIIKFEGKEAKGVLHFATHGYAFPAYNYKDTTLKTNSFRYSYRSSTNPMVRSGLILAGGNWAWTGSDTLTKLGATQNGILTALEVSQLNLKKTKLVVLSACETGLGKIEGSEGTFGLKRGFKLAGVEQMIVSLWSVPDKETMELMTLFYTDLAQTLNPVISFEKAQKEMRNRYPTEPEKWAGFVLVR